MFLDDGKGYTADELELHFQRLGRPYDKLTKRTIYYYAYEKNLFPIAHSGKGGFTEREIGYLKRIAELKDQGYALEEIRAELDPNYREYRMKSESNNLRINDRTVRKKLSASKADTRSDRLEAPVIKPARSSTIMIADGISLLVSGEISSEKLMRIVKAVEEAAKD
jgi:DNA-binding transcriptional MerR regulator